MFGRTSTDNTSTPVHVLQEEIFGSSFSPPRPSASILPYVPAIPAELRERPQWICWRWGGLQPNGKRKKLPLAPATGRGEGWQQPQAWASFEVALQTARRRGWGVGFVFSAADELVGIDFDECFDTSGALREDVRQWIELFGSYCERSVSGTGLHVIARGQIPHALASERAKSAGVEVYANGRWFVTTGRRFGPWERIAAGDFALDGLYTAYDGPAAAKAGAPMATVPYRPQAGVLVRVPADLRARVEKALGRLADWRADAYKAWIDVGMALSELGPVGLELWETFSQRCPAKYRDGECARVWQRFKPGQGRTLASLFFWADQDSPPAAPAPSTVEAEPSVIPPAQTRPAAPWVISPADWQSCVICGAWHQRAAVRADGGSVTLAHHPCRRRDCRVSRKLDASRFLGPILDWPGLFVAEVGENDWRRLRDQLRRQHVRLIGIPQPSGDVLALADAPFPGAVEGDLATVWAAWLEMPAKRRVRRAHAEAEEAAGHEDQPGDSDDEGAGVDSGTFASLSCVQRVHLLSVEFASAHAEEQALRSLKRRLQIDLGQEHGDKLKELWTLVGLQVKGNTAAGTLAQLQDLADRMDALRAELSQTEARQLFRYSSGGPQSKQLTRCEAGAGEANPAMPDEQAPAARGRTGGQQNRPGELI